MKKHVFGCVLVFMASCGAFVIKAQDFSIVTHFARFIQIVAQAHETGFENTDVDCIATGFPLADFNMILLKKQDDKYINDFKSKGFPFVCYQLTPIEQEDIWFGQRGLVRASELTVQRCTELQTLDIPVDTMGVSLKKVATEHDLKEFDCVSSQSFHDPEGFAFDFFKPILSHSDIELYVARYQDKVVGCCLLVIIDGVPSCHWLGVISEYRKQGIATAMAVAGLRDLKQRGYTELSIFTAPASTNLVQRVGFTPVCTFTCWKFTPELSRLLLHV